MQILMEVCKSQKGAIVLAFWVKYVDAPISIGDSHSSSQEAGFIPPHETTFSQRTYRKAVLWNLAILFIPEVLGFVPNAQSSLLQ